MSLSSSTQPERSHYVILGVTDTATCDEIKKAYRKLSLRWHPDKNPSNCREAQRRFDEISVAYQILTNGDQRELYDQKLSSTDGVRQSAVANGRIDQSLHLTEFKLRDSRTVFHDFFGGKDPFSEVFGIPDDVQSVPSVVDDSRGTAGVSQNTTSASCRPHFVDDDERFEESPSRRHVTPVTGSTIKSVATSTRFVHGKKIVTKKVVDNSVETVTVEEDGELKSKTVNGVAVALDDVLQDSAEQKQPATSEL